MKQFRKPRQPRKKIKQYIKQIKFILEETEKNIFENNLDQESSINIVKESAKNIGRTLVKELLNITKNSEEDFYKIEQYNDELKKLTDSVIRYIDFKSINNCFVSVSIESFISSDFIVNYKKIPIKQYLNTVFVIKYDNSLDSSFEEISGSYNECRDIGINEFYCSKLKYSNLDIKSGCDEQKLDIIINLIHNDLCRDFLMHIKNKCYNSEFDIMYNITQRSRRMKEVKRNNSISRMKFKKHFRVKIIKIIIVYG